MTEKIKYVEQSVSKKQSLFCHIAGDIYITKDELQILTNLDYIHTDYKYETQSIY